jgi:hypothetical protein
VSAPPFQKQESLDKPGIIGARWWQESLASDVPRRQALLGLAALGGVLATVAAVGTCAAHRSSSSSSSIWPSSTPEVDFQAKSALAMQRQYGWNFGATDEALVFDGKSTKPFVRTALFQIGTELAPASSTWAPFFVPTLFESVSAQPTGKLSDDTSTFTPLRDVLVPISTPATEAAFKQGRALASLLANAQAKDVAVIVDLPGPQAVAFAAGAVTTLDPVFLFDNWPHPRGVVPAHLTLASAAYYQPLFAAARLGDSAKSKRPLFVVDRNRLAAYTDDATQFDNRHVERLPSAKSLAAAGIRNVLYVAPNAVQRQELDDMVDDFLSYGAGSPPIQLHSVPATAFEPAAPGADAGDGETYYYGGSPTTNRTFFTHWSSPPSQRGPNELELYTPTPRASAFSSGTSSSTGAATRPRPTGFGMIPVAVAVGTGLVLGAKLNRNGSWNRTSSWSSGS